MLINIRFFVHFLAFSYCNSFYTRTSRSSATDLFSVSPKQIFSKLINDLRDISYRTNAVEGLLNLPEYKLSNGDSKALLVACVEMKSEPYLSRLINRLKDDASLTSELLYVGIKTACRKQAPMIAYRLLKEAHINRINVDIECVNSVLQILTKTSKLDAAWEIFQLAHNQQFGESVTVDLSTYSMIIECASRSKNTDLLVTAFQLLESNESIELDEDMYISVLNVVAFNGDGLAALQIMKSYLQLFQLNRISSSTRSMNKAFALVLIACITQSKSPSDERPLLDVDGTSTSEMLYHSRVIDAYVSRLLSRDMSLRSVQVANLAVQYYAIKAELSKAFAVFLWMTSSPSCLPSISTLLELSGAICRAGDSQKAAYVAEYMAGLQLQPFPQLADALSVVDSNGSTLP